MSEWDNNLLHVDTVEMFVLDLAMSALRYLYPNLALLSVNHFPFWFFLSLTPILELAVLHTIHCTTCTNWISECQNANWYFWKFWYTMFYSLSYLDGPFWNIDECSQCFFFSQNGSDCIPVNILLLNVPMKYIL